MSLLHKAEGHGCIPDAETVTSVWNCEGAQWLEQLTLEAPAVFSPRPVLLNVGANKGYAAPHFLSLWSQHPNATVQAWHRAIMDVARGRTAISGEPGQARRHGFLSRQMCGACGACHVKPTLPHSRDGGHVHLCEMAVANSLLLNHLINVTNLRQLVTVHNVAAANESGTVYAPKVLMGTEFETIVPRMSNLALARRRKKLDAKLDQIEQSTLDDLASRLQLPKIIDVCTVDTEGHDPLVLEGMAALLRGKRITLLEFEYHSKGFWDARNPDGRSLERTAAMLGDMGYRCFLEAPTSVYLPINEGCWRPAFERRKWSNVLCTHNVRAQDVINAKAWSAYWRRARRQAQGSQEGKPKLSA
jgi:FkbM family methyltransferase